METRHCEFYSRVKNLCNYCRSITKKKKKKHNKTALLANTKLNTIEVLISKSFVHSYINHDEFAWRKMCQKNIMRLKKKSKILKMLCNIQYKNNGKVLCQL